MEFNDCVNKFYEENPLIEICFNEEIYTPYLRIGNKYILIHKIIEPLKTCIIKLVVYKGTFICRRHILKDIFCCIYDEKINIVVSQNIFETNNIYNYIEHFAVK